MTALAVYPDPTELMVQNWPLGVQEYILGSVLLLTYVVLQLIALPLNIVRDSTPVSYKEVNFCILMVCLESTTWTRETGTPKKP